MAQCLLAAGFAVSTTQLIPDEIESISNTLRQLSPQVRLIVTTGGTGIGPRDVTPEATRAVCDRILDGFAERMRAEGLKDTPLAPLSRAVCGTRDTTLIVNVPGSPRGAVHSLQAVLPLIPHALALLAGNTEHDIPQPPAPAKQLLK